MIEVPAAFVHETAQREGAAGRAWLRELPDIAADLLQRWSCVLDGPAAIKVSERAGPDSLAVVADNDKAVTVLGELSRRLAVAAPPGLPRLRDEVAGWESEIRLASMPRRVVDAALAALRELDHPETVVHGDLHDANVLAGEREPWLAIDPKGVVGDPAYDAFTVIHSPRLLLTSGHRRALDVFCAAAGVDRERARGWALVRAVRAVLLGREHGPKWLVEAGERLIGTLVD
jgi:streptomycin 6-kinase